MKVLAFQIGPTSLVKVEVFPNHQQEKLKARFDEVDAALASAISFTPSEEAVVGMMHSSLLGNVVFAAGGFVSITKHNLDI